MIFTHQRGIALRDRQLAPHTEIRAYHRRWEGVRGGLDPARLYFFKNTGLGRSHPKGARVARLTDRRHHLTPRHEHLPTAGGPTPCFLTRQMSATRHTATTTCKASPRRQWRQPGTWLTPRVASAEARDSHQPHPHALPHAPSRIAGCFKAASKEITMTATNVRSG